MFVLVMAATLGTNPALPKEKRDDPKAAEGLPWTWSDEKATRDYCVKKHLHDYKVEVEGREARILNGNKVVCTFAAHAVFACSGDQLFLADYRPSSSGCGVIAIDLKTWKQLWKVTLQGLGPIEHSGYRTRINMETDGKTVTIWGNESLGRYVEMVDVKSGKIVGHKIFKRE